RARPRRRRLPGHAVRLGGAPGPGAGVVPAPLGATRYGRAIGRSHARPGHAQGRASRAADRAHHTGVGAARILHAKHRPHPHALDAGPARVGARRRPGEQHRRRVCRLSAPEDRRPAGAEAVSHHPRRRLCLEGRGVMTTPLSIRARLTLWYTGVVVAILLLVSVAAYTLLRWHLYNDLDASLFTVAGVLREAPPVDPAAPLPPDLEPLVREFLGSEFADALMQLLDPEGRLRSRALRPALPLSREARVNALRGAPTLETIELTSGEQARLLTMPVVRGGRIVDLVQVAMPLRRTHQTLLRYVETLLVLVPLGVVLSADGGWLLARRALRPVDRMSQSALRISAEDLSRRLERRGTQDEIDRLCLEALELGVRLAKGKGVNVSMGATAPVVVQGDAGALRRALLNLVDNAVKYTPAGGSVVISLERAGQSVALVVEDFGI